MARRLKAAGAASVMPAGSPIGSGQGVLNPQQHPDHPRGPQGGRPDYPVIVDAGVGTASDVAIAMELGCDGVLLNTGIAGAADPLRMAHAMRLACEAGYLAARAGRIPQKALRDGIEPPRRPGRWFRLNAGRCGTTSSGRIRAGCRCAPSVRALVGVGRDSPY